MAHTPDLADAQMGVGSREHLLIVASVSGEMKSITIAFGRNKICKLTQEEEQIKQGRE